MKSTIPPKEKEENITRIDVRIPNSLFEEIEALAVERGEPIHHRSGRVKIAPTLIDLIRIGIYHYSPEMSKYLSDKFSALDDNTDNTDTADIVEIDTSKLEQSIINKIDDQLDTRIKSILTKIISECSTSK